MEENNNFCLNIRRNNFISECIEFIHGTSPESRITAKNFRHKSLNIWELVEDIVCVCPQLV